MAASDYRRHRSEGMGKPRRPKAVGTSQHHDADVSQDDVVTNEPVLLPQDERAEGGLIDSALQDQEVLDRCSKVKPQYFFRHANQVIWAQMQELHAAGRPFEHTILVDALRTSGRLESAGGELAILSLGNRVTHSMFAQEYARIVCEKFLARHLLATNAMMAQVAYRGDTQEIASASTLIYTETQEVLAALGISPSGETNGARHRLRTIAEMRQRPRAEWIIPGILQERRRSLIFGDSNTGKSFLALDMALCLATGLPWHGRPVKAGPVVYVCAEDAEGIMDRVNLWLSYHKLDDAPLFRLIEDAPNLLDAAEVTNTIHEIKSELDEPPVLVVFDTLAASTAGGDENSAQDMGLAIAAMHRVQRECAAGVMVVHHSGKDPTKGPRGNSNLRADIDVGLEVSMDEATGLITVRGHKARGVDRRTINLGFRLRQFALDNYADSTSCILEALDEPPAPTVQAVRRKPTASDKLLDLMQEIGQPRLHGELCTAFIKAGYGVRGTFNRALQELWDRRIIECVNGLYRIIEETAQ